MKPLPFVPCKGALGFFYPQNAALCRGSAIMAGVWVVCLNLSLNPSTWGCVAWCNGNVAHVRYGKDAPIWASNTWETEYLRACESEDAARKVVADYEASIEYDPR